jgi:hypothetical protein
MKKTIRNILSILLFLSVIGLQAQTSFYKTSLAPDGGSAQNGNTYIIYTTGETFVQETGTSTIHLSEGFIGPDLAVMLGVEDFIPIEGVEIFPNPVKNVLKIRFQNSGQYEIRLFDLTGKLIFENNFEGSFLEIDMYQLRPSYYLLSITDRKNKRHSSFKIRKI